MKKYGFIILNILIICLLFIIPVHSENIEIAISPELKLTKLSNSSYIYTSNIKLQDGSVFPCNGLIHVSGDKAIIFSSPHNEKLTKQLISWIKNTLKVKIEAAFIHHFHQDGGIAGIKAFRAEKIKSYASEKTVKIAKSKKLPIPDFGFKNSLNLKLGSENIVFKYFGPAHTNDGSVAWIASENILFGGCMIKEVSSKTLGNIADADIKNYAGTVKKVRKEFSSSKIVIPGHGKYGGIELLDHTINLSDDLAKNKK